MYPSGGHLSPHVLGGLPTFQTVLADHVMLSYVDPLRFVFSAAEGQSLYPKVPSLANGYAGIIPATHSAAGYSSVSLIEEKMVL